ncbi:MAG TPA: deoxyhypusine synthase [Acidobacteriota bacterium]
MKKKPQLKGRIIRPHAVRGSKDVAALMENAFLSYNAGRLMEASRLFAERMARRDCTVGLSISGALTPAGLGFSCLIPLIENGFVDWVCSTGANLYHDIHHHLGFTMHQGGLGQNDLTLYENRVIRIYDILFDQEVLLRTDRFVYDLMGERDFQDKLSTPEFHWRLGRKIAEREEAAGSGTTCFLSAAYRYDVPLFTSSPGDSTLGLNAAALALRGNRFDFDVLADVNLSTAIVYQAKTGGGRSGVLILGGGSPKNFVLQTEPQIQEILGLEEKGHDYYIQFTDARSDTGGLSGATPSEAMTWGKVDPDQLASTVVCYLDSTIAAPLLTAYVLARAKPRKPRRLMRRLAELHEQLREAYRGVRLGFQGKHRRSDSSRRR